MLLAKDNISALLEKANILIEKNKMQDAITIYKELSKNDIKEANFNLGMIYGFGINDMDKNKKLAIMYLNKATLKHHKKAPYYLSMLLASKEDLNETKILMLIIESAVSGFDKAQLEFGKILLDQNKTKEAKEWIDKARKQGNTDAKVLWYDENMGAIIKIKNIESKIKKR